MWSKDSLLIISCPGFLISGLYLSVFRGLVSSLASSFRTPSTSDVGFSGSTDTWVITPLVPSSFHTFSAFFHLFLFYCCSRPLKGRLRLHGLFLWPVWVSSCLWVGSFSYGNASPWLLLITLGILSMLAFVFIWFFSWDCSYSLLFPTQLRRISCSRGTGLFRGKSLKDFMKQNTSWNTMQSYNPCKYRK